MRPISFLIITVSRVRHFHFCCTIEQAQDVLTLIGRKPIEWFDNTLHRKMLVYDDAFINELEDFATRHGSPDNPMPFNLMRFMKNYLKEGEPFYMFRMDNGLNFLTQIDITHAALQLQEKKANKEKDSIWNEYKDAIETLLKDYELSVLGSDNINIGKKTDDRVCRFCGKTKAGGATFKKVAHAISEGLGNKTLKCTEECDQCNARLADVEDNLSVGYLGIKRSILGSKGKGGVKSVGGQNFVLDAKKHQMILSEKTLIEDLGKQLKVKLEGRELFTMQGLYKALVKVVIDLVDGELLHHFRNTIQWINDKLVAEEFPPIRQYYSESIYAQPIIEIYIRKSIDDIEKGPYCFANLFVCDLILQFVVPFVDVDKGMMKSADMVAPYWDKMAVLLSMYNMQSEFIDCSSNEERTAWVELVYDKSDIKQADSPGKVSDNLKMLPPKWTVDNVEFPKFDPAIILSKEIHTVELMDVNDKVEVDEAWAHDTSNNIRSSFILDEEHNKVFIELSIEICNTDNTEHLLSCCVRAEFKIKDLGVVFANENNGQFSILKDFVIYTTVLALIELNRVIQPKFPIINLLKLDVENLCSHYRFGLKE